MKKKVNMLVEELGLNTRSLNSIKRAGINNVFDLVNLNKTSFYRIRNLGEKTCDQIVEKVHTFGYIFSWEDGFEEQYIDYSKFIVDIDEYLKRTPITNLGFDEEIVEYLKSKRKKNLNDLLSFEIDKENSAIATQIIDKVHSLGLKFKWEKNLESIPNASYLLLKSKNNPQEIENNKLKYEISKKEELLKKAQELTKEKVRLLELSHNLDEQIANVYKTYISLGDVEVGSTKK